MSFEWEITLHFTSPQPRDDSQCTQTKDTYKSSALVFQTGSMDSTEKIPGSTVDQKYSASMLKESLIDRPLKTRTSSPSTSLMEGSI